MKENKEKRYSEYWGDFPVFRMNIDGEEVTITEMTVRGNKVTLWGHKEIIREPIVTGLPVVKEIIKKVEMSVEEFLPFFAKVKLWQNKIPLRDKIIKEVGR